MKKDILGERNLLVVEGAREHNLRNISLSIPRNALTVITGLSGSGKSSLAFDTIYAEGNRRYLETFSGYARGFLGNLERPDVDNITGLSPVISIEQKRTVSNPRSTVGTTTEVYDLLRLLYARCATAYSQSGKAMESHKESEIFAQILMQFSGQRIALYAPLVRDRKGHYRELLEQMRRRGYLYVRVDGELLELVPGLALSRYKNHRIELLVDKLSVPSSDLDKHPDDEVLKEALVRLEEALRTALKLGKGVIMVKKYTGGNIGSDTKEGDTKDEINYFSQHLMDSTTGESYEEPAPHTFSFNSPQGACPKCKGIGVVPTPDMSKIVPNGVLSVRHGALVPIGKYKPNMIFKQLTAIIEHHGYSLNDPFNTFPEELIDDIMNGVSYPLRYKVEATGKMERLFGYNGLISYLKDLADDEESPQSRKWANQFNSYQICPSCHGNRLNPQALSFRINGSNISEICSWSLPKLLKWIKQVPKQVEPSKEIVAKEIVKEIATRVEFLLEMGLDYLSLDRATGTLSGGEMQRIRLATQLGSSLVNVLYILDEPSIGLHQRDNSRLIKSLQKLRDQGNSLIVVEHDKDMMLSADYIVDMGPGAGRKGGYVVYAGTPSNIRSANTLTAKYINGENKIEIPKSRRMGKGVSLKLTGATGNNLKGETLEIPLGKLVLITGVSGSGKSSYINDTLYPALSKHFYRSLQEPLPYGSIEGIEYIDKVVQVDQSPIGRIPRSNPATYTGVFTDIRNLFYEMPESKIRAYKPGRFSFNVKGGRCETCKGNGYKKIEMNFLPDVYVPCETCKGKRYNRETLEVRYKGKTIADVLDMTVNMAVEFFDTQPVILRKIKALQDVGLGYIKLGQSSNTLSGGEAQRVKLATELMKRDTGKTIYFLDEPTTGLHFEDIRMLMEILMQLVDKGNTVVIIEHNLDVIKVADHIIEIGPEGGEKGGHIVFSGTPEEMIAQDKGYTTPYLRKEMNE